MAYASRKNNWGEVRGPEALEYASGHELQDMTVPFQRVIANSSRDMLSRLETMVLSGALMPLEESGSNCLCN